MKAFVTYMLILFITIFGTIIVFNYFIDPANIYSNTYVEKALQGPQNGLNTTNIGNMNERSYKLGLCKLYKKKHFDYLALGSSRVMTLSTDALNGKSLLNLGVSGCKFEDMIALVEICKDMNITYDNVIIAADPTLFNENDKDSRWKTISNYYYEFLNQDDSLGLVDWSLIENLISASYFKSSLGELGNIILHKNQMSYVKSTRNNGFTVRTDGSIYYDKKYRELPQQEIDELAKVWTHGSYKDFEAISKERVDKFEKLMGYFNNNNIGVIFFDCPYHPIFYHRISQLKGIIAAWDYTKKYAEGNKFRVVGSFNPNDIGFTNSDFYDAPHARKESIDRFFKNDL